ncbi:MAG: hypothetical protein U9O94_05235 [Nanoarchaeota archaeon]|nr:hypothetical protein [Nanoarchaeota archaeon]
MNKIIKLLDEGKPEEVKSFFIFNREEDYEMIRKKFLVWSKWFFPQYFSSNDASFHKEMDLGNIGVYKNGESFLNIGFRGCSKTTRTKLFVAFCIANDEDHYRKYYKVLSKELNNAKQATTDVYNILVNRRVRALYPGIFQKTIAKREETMSSFTTSTGIKMTADTIGTDQRGDIQDESRPDFIWFEDFETRLSLMSAVTTHKIWQNMEEAKNGLSKEGGMIFNCNYISERGNVHKLVRKIRNQIMIPLEINGEATWPERYTKDDIQKIKREAEDYEGEFQCKPSASKDVYFDRESVDKQMAKQPIDEIAGLKIFKKYNPMNRVGSGHDVGGGVGLDSSTSVFMDFDCNPVQVIATYANNEIKPDAFAYEIVRQGKRFGENYVAVEKNYGSTIDILKTIYPLNKLHRTERNLNRILNQDPKEYGWETNRITKVKMLADFSKAIEDGLVELNDQDLINEARSFTLDDLMDKEVDPRLTTRHFDLLTAACICWQINKNVKKIERPLPYDPWKARIHEAQNKKNPAR